MSEFSNKRQEKLQKLNTLALKIIKNDGVFDYFNQIKDLIDEQLEPRDVVDVVDFMVRQEIPTDELKKAVNKILNLFYKAISEYKNEHLDEKSFLWYLAKNNEIVDKKLNKIRPLIKEVNKHGIDEKTKTELIDKFTEIQKFTAIYVIKENILFPAVEKYLENFRCVQIMWAFHDDVKRNLKELIELLQKDFDLKRFNRLTADIFFNIRAVTFRDNKILFPVVQRIIPQEEFEKMLEQSIEFDYPFVKPKISKNLDVSSDLEGDELVKLPTGTLTVEQIALIFNHLPVDLTFVDENNKVRYFSQPKSRVFPRTIGVIGRDVRNCHPPDSVHIVEKIVEKFRSGEKDVASFWIKMGQRFVLIRYFAVRDEKGTYRGVLEVSQEIQDIKQLEGERRLLEWDDEKN